ncbi:MAG: hypothetical protein JEZ09_19905 [Salinivirgaceae bacterium]|nr:hypothetical protein [Salinivirgaceae bacterium]
MITNAIKFTDSGEIRVGYSSSDSFIHFYVADTGIGIKVGDLDGIFEKFEKLEYSSNKSYRGMGIGLTISQHIIELLGGKIWVESQFGVGSTFHFQIPLS